MDEIEAGADLIREFHRAIPAEVASWLRRSGDDHRCPYLASDRIDSANRAGAADEPLRIVRRRPSLFLDPFRVNLVPGDDRLAIAAAATNERSPDGLGHRLGSQPFGEASIADAYINPARIAAGFPRPVA